MAKKDEDKKAKAKVAKNLAYMSGMRGNERPEGDDDEDDDAKAPEARGGAPADDEDEDDTEASQPAFLSGMRGPVARKPRAKR